MIELALMCIIGSQLFGCDEFVPEPPPTPTEMLLAGECTDALDCGIVDAQTCLALNVYHEARNQSVSGQVAVAQITMNRVHSASYPDDVCEVVYDHKQFSWYWDGKSDVPHNMEAWEKSQLIASAVIAGSGHADLVDVMHYHAVYVEPYWTGGMRLVAHIDDHMFYAAP